VQELSGCVLVALECTLVIFVLRCAVAVGEGSFRLGILSGGPLISLFDMLLKTRGDLGTYVPLVVRPLRWFFCRGSFHFVPCIPLLLGALVYL
jgi:hypothetical protein